MLTSPALETARRYVGSIPKNRDVTAEEAMVCAQVAQADMLAEIAHLLQAMTTEVYKTGTALHVWDSNRSAR